jgi:hypothetical protein
MQKTLSVRNNAIESLSNVALGLRRTIQMTERSDVDTQIEIEAATPLRSLDVEDVDERRCPSMPSSGGFRESSGFERRSNHA